ncbi:MAG: coenzyme F420-0:L-glutamate ligase [archaeon GB-1867-005]|nr:coenzyme F420-0:L-glutamate ligase [Candidatus Culexmicrobium cathedralense]
MSSLKLKGKAIKTKYWLPGEEYLKYIIAVAKKVAKDGDIIVISEKALSIAHGKLIDESKVNPNILSIIFTFLWMRIVWAYVLGPLCKFKLKTINFLRKYPLREGAAHKQICLRLAGPLQALKHYSEGGIDLSNVPYSYACLPLENPQEVAEKIKREILMKTGKKVGILIVDSDKTYSLGRLHITSRPTAVKGIKPFMGLIALIIGRAAGWKIRATPIASAGIEMGPEDLLKIADFADKVRGSGAGATAWEVAERFKVKPSEVTWSMLLSIKHKPIVVVRVIRNEKRVR